MTRLTKRGHVIDLQILDNECSAAYKLHIEEKWGAKLQPVPPDVHCRSIAKRAIRTFKAHLLSILDGISGSLPNYLWDRILPQTDITLNLILAIQHCPFHVGLGKLQWALQLLCHTHWYHGVSSNHPQQSLH